jgi:beta-glucosidase
MTQKKIRELLSQMTLDEKIQMIHGTGFFHTGEVKRLGIPQLMTSDGPMGVRGEFYDNKWVFLGHNDDYVTYLPCNSALACTFNRKLAEVAGFVLGEEARGRGKDVILAPGINLKRSPLCGRNFEYFSEDGYLTAELAIPFVRGIQKNDVAACVKHFAVNNQETQRLEVDTEVDEEVLRDTYLEHFKKVLVDGGAYTVMSAYNKLYGEYCSESEFLLTKVLRDEWNYKGLVISDWGAIKDSKKAALAGCDIDMSVTDDFDNYKFAEPLKKAVLAGEVPEAVIDTKVMRILNLMNRLHMLDGRRKAGSYNSTAHQKAAYSVAAESVVLLKNNEKVLPLDKSKLKRVLVVGDNAIRAHSLGGGSAEIRALYEVAPLLGLKERLGGNTKVDYLQGYCTEIAKDATEYNWQEKSLESQGIISDKRLEEKRILLEKTKEEIEKVKKALEENDYDSVIFVGGLTHNQDVEGCDRQGLELPYGQDETIKEILKIRKDAVIILIGGSSVTMNEWIDQADTLIWSYYNGCEGGRAIADVLLGNVNPSGKLPETFYKDIRDCSAHSVGTFGDTKVSSYKEGHFVGYKYTDAKNIPVQFPFGYGLSYTTFSLEGETVDMDKRELVVNLHNKGRREGKEVVFVYGDSIKKGVRELIGFEKISLARGKKTKVRISFADGYENVSTSRV